MRLEFTPEEYQLRWDRASRLMQEQELDGLLITSEANYNYFSGYRIYNPWATFSRPVLLLHPRGRKPILMVQGFMSAVARRDTVLDDVREYETVGAAPLEKWVGIFEEAGLLGKRIGAELGYEQRLGMSYADFEGLKRALNGTEFVDAAQLLWSLRMQKSAAEIEAHRRACEITGHAFEAAFAQARQGVTERELARAANSTIAREGAEPGFHIVCSGPGNYELVGAMPTDRRFQPGDLIHLDLGAIYNGYWSDFSREIALGSATDRQKTLYEQTVKLADAGIEAAVPGAKAIDILRAFEREADRLEMDPKPSTWAGRSGHGIGLMSTEPPDISRYDQTVLKPGMVICVEPIVLSQHGAFIPEEIVAITEAGNEVLTPRAPRELPIA